MTRHVGWVADEFLMGQGFVITDPGPGLPRHAARGHLSFELEPRCRCEYCPAPNNPNYRIAASAAV